MGHRSYRQRCGERIERLRGGLQSLERKIQYQEDAGNDCSFERQQASALAWAIEQIEFLDSLEETLASQDLSDSEKIAAIEGVIEARKHPSAADMERNQGLRKTMERRRSAVTVGVQ